MSNQASVRKDNVISDRKFGFFIASMLLLLWLYFTIYYRVHWWMLAVSIVLLGLSIARPAALRWLKRSWLKSGELLGQVVGPLSMAIVFFLVVTPTALFLRAIRKDPLGLTASDASSFWVHRASSRMQSMRDQY
jgi:hypothetical protein